MSQQIRSAFNEDSAFGSDWNREVIEDGESLVAMPFNFSGVFFEPVCTSHLRFVLAPCQLAWQEPEFLELEHAQSPPLRKFRPVGCLRQPTGRNLRVLGKDRELTNKTCSPVRQAHKGSARLVGYKQALSMRANRVRALCVNDRG